MIVQSGHCSTFSIGEARHIVRDLFEPRPAIYWADFLGSMAVGGVCYLAMPRVASWPLAMALWCGAVLAFYRAVLFTHELTHLKKGAFLWFRLIWNVLCGVPFLIPSVLYETHVAHHARRHYGTREDGEYFPFARRSVWYTLGYLGQPLVLPLVAIVRFGIITPLAWLHPGLRTWAIQHASSMVLDPRYLRPLPTTVQLRAWRAQEIGCFLVVAATAAGLAGGVTPWHFVLRAYAVSLGILALNAVRTLAAHRFRNDGDEMTFVDQLLDSWNFPEHPVSGELWAPVGLRFHALHHLFPSLPYHNLGIAHRRLMAELPANSPYRLTNSPSLPAAMLALWREIRTRHEHSSPPQSLGLGRAA